MHTIKTGVYECDICSTNLKMPRGLYGNMKRHFKNKHPYIYAKETNVFDMDSDKEDNNEKKSSVKHVNRNWINKYMTTMKSGIYSCVICDVNLKMQQGCYNNMKRHFRVKHPSIYAKESNDSYVRSQTNDSEEECLSVNNKTSGQEICKNTTDLLKDISKSSEATEEKQLQYVFVLEKQGANKNPAVDTNTDVDNDSDITNVETDIENEVADMERIQLSDPDFETKVKILCQRGPKGKRNNYKSCFWNFFNWLHTNLYTCLICDKNLYIFNESVGNLKRHILLKHKVLFDIILKYAPESDTSVHNNKNDDDPKDKERLVDLKKNVDKDMERIRSATDIENKVVPATDGLEDCDFLTKIKILCQRRPKDKYGNYKSIYWNFFEHVDGGLRRCCLFCNISFSNEVNIRTLKSHIILKHRSVYDAVAIYIPKCATSVIRKSYSSIQIEQGADLNKDVNSELETINFETQIDHEEVLESDEQICGLDLEAKIKMLCQNPPKGTRNNHKTCFWNFFTVVRENKYACIICEQVISTWCESVGNLKRHIILMHKDVFNLMLKYAPESDVSVHNYASATDSTVLFRETYDKSDFEVLDDGVKCKTCDVILIGAVREMDLFEHVKENHPDRVVFRRGLPTIDQHMNTIMIASEDDPLT